MERLRASGIRVRCRRSVELIFEPPPEAVVGGLVRSGSRLGRHGADSQLADDVFPYFGVLANVVDVDVVERQPNRAQLRHEQRPGLVRAVYEITVVTGDAILVDESPLR